MKGILFSCLIVVLVSCAPIAGTHTFIPPATPSPVSMINGRIDVPPLTEGQWVIIAGNGGFLDGHRVGGGDKCFVVEIEGPTAAKHTIKENFLFGFVVLEETSFDSHIDASFADAAQHYQALYSGLDFCKGVDIWTINK